MVKDVWCRSGLAIGNTYQGCFAGWLNGTFMRFTKDQLCMVAAVLMALWHAHDTKGTGGVSHAVSAPHAIDNGGFVAAVNGPLDCVLDPPLAEAMAFRLEPPVLEPDWNHPSKVPVPVSAILEPRTSGSKPEPNLGHAYPISGSWCDF
nr:hypothetical protein Iba_chr14aCG4900 [Ipomoea batatas]